MCKLQVNDIDMYYEIHGEGKPLVLIEGLASDHNAWMPHIEELKEQFQCLVFDNRGMGQTDCPEIEYTSRMYAEDTAKLMEGTGFGQAHIVGLSMGASVAQELCLAHPDKVLSMMLVSGWARADNFFKELINHWINLAENDDPNVLWMDVLLWSFSPIMFNERPDDIQELKVGVLQAEISPEAFVRQAQSLITHDAFDRLKNVKVPTLILVGQEDILTPYRLARELHMAIPNSKLKVLKEQAHAFPLENPQVLIDEIINFTNSQHTM
jgi:pimeloyl-ACP methyl ester carboxylesterase